MNMNYLGMTIPEKICVAITNRNKSVATKYVEGNNGSRMDTLKGKMKEGTVPSVIDNIPYAGFIISKLDYSHWSVKDPRGFELSLPENNILDLINKTVIDKGEIISKCVWAWKRSLYLVSVDDPDYDQLVKNSDVSGDIIKKCNQLSVGDKVMSSYGEIMIYYGCSKMFSNSTYYERMESNKKYWFKVITNSSGTKCDHYEFRSSGCTVTLLEPGDGSLIEADALKSIVKNNKNGRYFPVDSMKDVSYKSGHNIINRSDTSRTLHDTYYGNGDFLAFKLNSDDYYLLTNVRYDNLDIFSRSGSRSAKISAIKVSKNDFESNNINFNDNVMSFQVYHKCTGTSNMNGKGKKVLYDQDIVEFYSVKKELYIKGIKVVR